MTHVDLLLEERDLAERCWSMELDGKAAAFLRGSEPVAWVGSGLSAVAADLGCRVCHERGRATVRLTPYEYCRLPEVPYLTVLITYGGRNLDSRSVAEHVRRTRARRVLLVTGHRDSACRQILDESGADVACVTFPPHVHESRFVALLPLLGSAALSFRLAAATGAGTHPEGLRPVHSLAIQSAGEFLNRLASITDGARRRWVVLAAGAPSAAAMAWQVLWSESALGDLVVADLRDYTHGRYLSTLRRDDSGIIVLADDGVRNLANVLIRRFEGLIPVVPVRLSGPPALAAWEGIVVACASIAALCRVEGWDLRSPPKPAASPSWANWGRIRSTAGALSGDVS